MSSKIDPIVVKYCKTKDIKLRDELIVKYTPLIKYIAKKLAFNRDDTDDLIQIGSIAVLKALERFQIDKETDFATFATPNIIGEIKHYFRDKNKLVKVPRKLQELYSKIKGELRKVEQSGAPITISDIAKNLEVTEELVLEAMEAGQNSRIVSLDGPSYSNDFFKGSSNEPSILDNIGSNSKEEVLLNKETLKQAIIKLSPRERRVIYLRFYGDLSQAEIAIRMKLSQMHISRLLSKAIKNLRKHIKS